MCPEYGATVAIFPIDDMTLEYLRLTGRDADAGRAGRSLREGAGPVPHRRRRRTRTTPTRSSSICRRSSPAWPDRAGRRIACRWRRRRRRLRRRSRTCRRASRRSRPRRRRHGGRHGHAARTRLGRDRRDHELHQHVESERDDWRGPGREEGGRAGPDAQAVGEDQPGAGLEGRHRVPREGGPAAVSRPARLQSRRLRLHDVHRQQRPAAGRDRRRSARARAGRRVRAERQSQLRRPHPAGRARQLSRVAAAGRRLCAGRLDERRRHARIRSAPVRTASPCT